MQLFKIIGKKILFQLWSYLPATLPQQDEIIDTIMDFRSKFDGANVYNVVSYDCKKTIPLINKEGFAEMPHYMFEQYSDILKTIDHCKKFKNITPLFRFV